jgi:hypothetical protein
LSEQKILSEIIQGYSKIGDSFFFKHPTVADRLNVSYFEEELESQARSLGFYTKEENVAKAILAGRWSEDKDEEIKVLKWDIDAKKRNLPKLQDPSLKAELESKIQKDIQALSDLQKERRTFEGISLEDYVFSKLPMKLCSREVFEDSSFSTPISHENIKIISKEYLEKNSELTKRDSLLKAVFIPSFFDLFFIFDSIDRILGKNIFEMTCFQKELMGYGKVLHSKLTRMLDIPEKVKNDPISLYLYEEKKDKKEVVETNIRKDVERIGGLDNLKPEHKLT